MLENPRARFPTIWRAFSKGVGIRSVSNIPRAESQKRHPGIWLFILKRKLRQSRSGSRGRDGAG